MTTKRPVELEAGITLRCTCWGTKKAAEVHPRQDLTIVFGKGAKNKHLAVLEPLELFRLLFWSPNRYSAG